MRLRHNLSTAENDWAKIRKQDHLLFSYLCILQLRPEQATPQYCLIIQLAKAVVHYARTLRLLVT
jgi:hypothetical protein